MIFNYCIFISTILLLLSMIESTYAWPLLTNNNKQSVLQKQLFNDDYNENIVIIIPKPNIENDNKFHTVSCFQDIMDEEDEEENNEQDDDLMFLFDDEGYYYDEDYQQQEYENNASTFDGVLDFFILIKDTFNSILEYNWSSNWENITESKEQKDKKFQLYFDV
jgi:hypothetical protein